MLNVYLCEDNKEHLEHLNRFISNTIMINELDMKLELATDCPNELLNKVIDNKSLGAYFLDIHLSSSMSGLQLAAKIREYDPRGFIVFITSHSEMSYLTFQYKVEALDFIIKDKYNKINERVSDCLINIQEKYSNIKNGTQKVFLIKTRDKSITEPYENILFFQMSESIHKVVMHAMNRQVEFYSTLKELESLLDDRFYRCKDSCIVNKDLISDIDLPKRIIRMANGETCSASVRLIKGLIKILNKQ